MQIEGEENEMINLTDDIVDLNKNAAEHPTRRYIIIQRKIKKDDGKIVQFRLFDADSIADARKIMSQCVDDYKVGFNMVFPDETKQMLICENKFELPCACGMYVVNVYDALNFAGETSSGYLWQFNNQGVPVSCSTTGN